MQETSMNSAGVTVSDSPTPANLFDEFEEAFHNCLAPLTKEDPLNGINQEELKVNAETNSQRFLELAHRMEAFFLQKRFLLSVQKPEALISEENFEMRNELQRKEELIKKQTEKLSECQNTLMGLISRVGSVPGNSGRAGIPVTSMASATSGVHASQMGSPAPINSQTPTSMPITMSSSTIGMSHGVTGSQSSANLSTSISQTPMMSQARMGSTSNSGAPIMSQGSFSSMHGGSPMSSSGQSSINTMSASSMGPSHSSNMGSNVSAGAAMQAGSVPQGSGMYSGMGGMGQSQGGLQGPLAFLEKTTTNIGMPESRR